MKFLEIDFHTVSIEFQSIGFEWPRVWNREEGLYSDSALKDPSFNSGSILRWWESSRRHRSESGWENHVQSSWNSHGEGSMHIWNKFSQVECPNRSLFALVWIKAPCVRGRDPVHPFNPTSGTECLWCEGAAGEACASRRVRSLPSGAEVRKAAVRESVRPERGVGLGVTRWGRWTSSALVLLTHGSTPPLVFGVQMLPHLRLAEAGGRAHPRAAQVPGTENTRDHPRPHPFSIPFPIPDSRPLCPCLGPAGDNHRQPQHLRASKSSEPITSRHARLPSAFLPRKPRKRSAPQLPSSVSCPTQELLRVVSTRYAICEYTCCLSREGLSWFTCLSLFPYNQHTMPITEVCLSSSCIWVTTKIS